MMSSWCNPFEQRETLVNLCSGVEATKEVQNDLLEARAKGERAFNIFLTDRIKSSSVSFYDPIRRLSLKTFHDLKMKETVKFKEKSLTIAAERSIFARMLIIAKCRPEISLKHVLSFSLGPIPWSLGLPDGGLVKTVKSKLLGTIESSASIVTHEFPRTSAMIYDGMVIFQQRENVKLANFGDVSEFILRLIL